MSTIEPGLYEMTNAEYQALPSLSASGMKTLLRAPAKFAWQREHAVFKGSYDFGSLWHKLLLHDETEQIVIVQKKNKAGEIVESDTRETVYAKAHIAEIHAAGHIPALRSEYDKARAMVDALREHAEASSLLDLAHGDVEQSALWIDEPSGVPLRVRFDYLPHADHPLGFTIADPKTCVSSEPWQWLKKAYDYGYPIQDALYRRAAREFGLHDRPDFVFVCQEKEPPYIVSVIRLDAEARAIGDHLVDTAIRIYADCTARDDWSGGYVNETYTGALPGFITSQFEGVI